MVEMEWNNLGGANYIKPFVIVLAWLVISIDPLTKLIHCRGKYPTGWVVCLTMHEPNHHGVVEMEEPLGLLGWADPLELFSTGLIYEVHGEEFIKGKDLKPVFFFRLNPSPDCIKGKDPTRFVSKYFPSNLACRLQGSFYSAEPLPRRSR